MWIVGIINLSILSLNSKYFSTWTAGSQQCAGRINLFSLWSESIELKSYNAFKFHKLCVLNFSAKRSAAPSPLKSHEFNQHPIISRLNHSLLMANFEQWERPLNERVDGSGWQSGDPSEARWPGHRGGCWIWAMQCRKDFETHDQESWHQSVTSFSDPSKGEADCARGLTVHLAAGITLK